MKVLSAKNYNYLGTRDRWHVFVSNKKSFDPEVILLYRARMIMEDGSSIFYDPIVSPAVNTFHDQLVLSGTASDGHEYQLTLDVDSELDDSRVCEESCTGRPQPLMKRSLCMTPQL